MSGKHDRGGDVGGSSLLSTGPILIRGVGRGVRAGLMPGRESRHRGADGEPQPTDAADSSETAGSDEAGGAVVEPDGAAAVQTDEAGGAVVESDEAPPAREGGGTQKGGDGMQASASSDRDPAETVDSYAQQPDHPPAPPRADDEEPPVVPSPPAGPTRPPRFSTQAAQVLRGLHSSDPASALLDGAPPAVDAHDAAAGARRTSTAKGAGQGRARSRATSRRASPVKAPEAEPAAEDSRSKTTGDDERSSRDEATVGEPASPIPAALGVAPAAEPPEAEDGRPDAAASRAARPAAPLRPARPPFADRVSREAIGIAVLVLLALVCAGLIAAVVVKTRDDAASAAREAAAYTPPPLATPTPVSSGPVIAVLGDETALSHPSSTSSASQWPALVAKAVDGAVTTLSAAGYAASAQDESFASSASRVPENATVVIIAGGSVDPTASPVSLANAATTTYSAVEQQAPRAKLIVVGPFLSSVGSAAELATLRDTLRSSAMIAKAKWLDPVGAGWIASPTATSLSAADQKTVAAKLRSAVASAVKTSSPSTSPTPSSS